MDNVMPLDHVLLVAEVVSEPSIKRDREIKPALCAGAGIPLYLLIDRFTEPQTLTFISKPGENGYARSDTVTFGCKLRLPAPIQFTIDTSMLPLPS
jgi:Uma2 family endonuclease